MTVTTLELTTSRESILPVSSSRRSFGSGTVAATSVCQANRVRNEHRGVLVYGEPDTRLQKISCRNEDLQSCGGGIFAFDEIYLEDCLTEVRLTFDGCAA